MAIKTFTTGEVLTAADTNTYLANSGLVFVKQQTVGTAVSTVSVTDAFNATYENYKIIFTAGASSTATVIDLSLTGSTNGHYAVMLYNGYGGGGSVVASNNRANWTHAGGGVSNSLFMSVELLMPFLAKPTYMSGPYSDAVNTGSISGYQSQASSFTGFTIAPAAGTLTGGTITVYGYRKG
jgi:hypothetical protein